MYKQYNAYYDVTDIQRRSNRENNMGLKIATSAFVIAGAILLAITAVYSGVAHLHP